MAAGKLSNKPVEKQALFHGKKFSNIFIILSSNNPLNMDNIKIINKTAYVGG
jgi:hypothetical protein